MKGVFMNFTLPKLKKYTKNGKKDWRIEYYFEDKRLQIKCNKWRENFKTDREAEDYISEYIIVLIDQMKNGVNPLSATPQKTDLKLSTLIEKYLKYYYDNNPIACDTYNKVPKRLKDYENMKKKIIDFITSEKMDIKCKDITLSIAQNILLKMQNMNQWSEERMKKYKSIFTNAFDFGIEEKHCTENPFKKVKIIATKTPQKRRNVSNEEWNLISTELKNNNYNFYVFCKFVLHLIRPAELARVKKKYINLDNMTICLPAEITKTNQERTIYIQKSFYADFALFLKQINFNDLKNDTYLFGKKFKPAEDYIIDSAVSIAWRNVCNKLNIEKSCELYGLRHKGITDMANAGIPLNVIRLQAGHSKTTMTNHYANHYNEQAIEFLQNA